MPPKKDVSFVFPDEARNLEQNFIPAQHNPLFHSFPNHPYSPENPYSPYQTNPLLFAQAARSPLFFPVLSYQPPSFPPPLQSEHFPPLSPAPNTLWNQPGTVQIRQQYSEVGNNNVEPNPVTVSSDVNLQPIDHTNEADQNSYFVRRFSLHGTTFSPPSSPTPTKQASNSHLHKGVVGYQPNPNARLGKAEISTRVLLCGIPLSMPRGVVCRAFADYKVIKMDRPFSPYCTPEMNNQRTFVYLTLESQEEVIKLLRKCYFNDQTYEYYYKMVFKNTSELVVQIIPWNLEDNVTYFRDHETFGIPNNVIVMISGLPGFASATQVAQAAELFGEIQCCQLFHDVTDGVNYPTGEGILFYKFALSQDSALHSGVIQIVSSTFVTEVKLKPRSRNAEFQVGFDSRTL